jgi:hypothetical protein
VGGHGQRRSPRRSSVPGIVATYDAGAGGTSILLPDARNSLVVDVDITVTVLGGVRCVYHLNGARVA